MKKKKTYIESICNGSFTQMTTMRSAKSMMEVETPRNQSNLLSLTLILPSFKAHLILTKWFRLNTLTEPFCK